MFQDSPQWCYNKKRKIRNGQEVEGARMLLTAASSCSLFGNVWRKRVKSRREQRKANNIMQCLATGMEFTELHRKRITY